MDIKINILGTEYEIRKDETGTNQKLKNANGYCETYEKVIVIDFDKNYINDPDNVNKFDKFQDKTLRHEIVHAFLHESGLDGCSDWARNEEIVDWIALQLPKIVKVMSEAECL